MIFNHPLLAGLAASGLLLFASQSHAQCQEPQLPPGTLGYSVCKDWPAYPGQTLTAVAEREPDSTSALSSRDGSYSLSLAVVSSADGQPLASVRQAAMYVSDAFYFDDLSLDTGRFQLAPEVRAFGVRASFRGSSRVNPLDQVGLNLYVREGTTLRPVLEKFLAYSYSGEWDGNCSGQRQETTRTLDIGKTRSHGYADLIVRSVTTTTTGRGKGDSCQSTDKTAKPVLTTLRYDGERYPLPESLKSL